MNILVSIFISACMVLGSMAYTQETKAPALGASQSISSLTAKTTLQGDDTMVIVDNSGTPTTKRITVTNATTSMKAYNDLTYTPLFTTSAGLRSQLSDETGSGGAAVFATSPTISGAQLTGSPALTTPSFDVAGTDATGDIYYNGGSGVLTRLAAGSSNEFLRITGGLPDWDNTALITNPMTASSTFTANVTFASTTQHDATSTFSGGVVGVVDYWTATASSSWNKPNGVSTSSIMVIEVWGAGGAGGGTDSGGGTPYGGGGGGGGYLRYEMLTSTATSTVFCRVGGGGVGAINTAGTAGGNTTFGTFATAYGGGGGGNANGAGNNGSGGGGGGTPAAGSTGAAGTAAFAGGGYGASATLNQDGHAGGFAAAYNGGAGGASVYGGGGGGAPSASGGASVYGGGGGGGGNGSSASASVYAGAGGGANVAGTAPAGGGGGASGQGVAGKGGGNGQCKITTWK